MTHIPESILAAMPYPLVWKDLNSVFMYSSLTCAKWVGLSSMDKMVGLTDHHIPVGPSSYAERFIEQDRLVIQQKRRFDYLEQFRYADGVHTVISTKTPVLNEQGECVGTCCYLQDVHNKLLLDTIYKSSKLRSCSNFVLENEAPEGLTNKEYEVLFLLLHGKSAREIAALLHRSLRTVESHMNTIKEKFQVENKSSLVAAAIQKGYLAVIPKWLINSRHLGAL